MQCRSLQKQNVRLFLLTSLVLVLYSTSALAQEDGELDSTSEGTSEITIIKQDAVQITGINDIDMGISAVLSEDQSVSDDVCVFSSTGGYNLTVTSANNGFLLSDSNTSTDIAYSLEWITTASTQLVGYGSQVTGFVGDSNSLDCSGSTNASFRVTIVTTNFNSADPGTYTDTMTLLVQPE